LAFRINEFDLLSRAKYRFQITYFRLRLQPRWTVANFYYRALCQVFALIFSRVLAALSSGLWLAFLVSLASSTPWMLRPRALCKGRELNGSHHGRHKGYIGGIVARPFDSPLGFARGFGKTGQALAENARTGPQLWWRRQTSFKGWASNPTAVRTKMKEVKGPALSQKTRQGRGTRGS
jgi:hypothetical protein